jgi:hypothetical protein
MVTTKSSADVSEGLLKYVASVRVALKEESWREGRIGGTREILAPRVRSKAMISTLLHAAGERFAHQQNRPNRLSTSTDAAGSH